MTRWLLNTFPTWALALIVIGALVTLNLAGMWLVRRVLPGALAGELNEIAGVMTGLIAGFYGVFLAFAVVVLYEEFHESTDNVQTEAVALARVVRDSEAALPGPLSDRMRAAVRAYRDTVVGDERDAMQYGNDSAAAWREVRAIFGVLREHEPRGARETAFYEAAVVAANDLVVARRARLNDAESELPGAFMALLVGGAVLTIGFTVVFGVPNRRAHAFMGLSLAVLLGFCILVAIVLDHPFSGEVRVAVDPYYQGALADV